jgi:hypothetical protein
MVRAEEVEPLHTGLVMVVGATVLVLEETA